MVPYTMASSFMDNTHPNNASIANLARSQILGQANRVNWSPSRRGLKL